MSRTFLGPGRVPVYAGNAIAATSHPLATLTAIDVLKSGGNAIDAAIAAVAVLGVVEPHMTGIGGDCFALIKKSGSDIVGINGSGRAGKNASAQTLRDNGLTDIARDSAHSVTVPGAISAWQKILDLAGTRGLDTLLAPAIDCAENGFVVAPRVAADWNDLASGLMKRETASAVLCPNGRAPRVGERFRFPGLGKAMREICEQGSQAFYSGKIADDLIRSIEAEGGNLTHDDLSSHTTDEVNPIRSDYRETTLVELPPNTQGLTAQLILNILESFDISDLHPLSGERFHLEVEAARLAYGARNEFISDPATMTVTPQELLSKAYGLRLASSVSLHKRLETLPPFAPRLSDTVYLCVADEHGNAISLINSLFDGFGSGIVTQEFGIPLHSRGGGFNLIPGHPNELGAGKRPMHTIIPAMTLENDQLRHVFGVMGGQYQSMGHAHVLSNIVDFNMDIQEALDCPRVFWDEHQRIGLEATASSEALAHLQSCGHDAEFTHKPWGGGQILEFHHEHGTLSAASDPRKDGLALGY